MCVFVGWRVGVWRLRVDHCKNRSGHCGICWICTSERKVIFPLAEVLGGQEGHNQRAKRRRSVFEVSMISNPIWGCILCRALAKGCPCCVVLSRLIILKSISDFPWSVGGLSCRPFIQQTGTRKGSPRTWHTVKTLTSQVWISRPHSEMLPR